MVRIIFHIDVNSAFVSWLGARLVREGKPDIRLVPSAASIPSKKPGIRVPEPVSMALRKCPDLVIMRADWEWYKKCPVGFIAICRSYSPVLQPCQCRGGRYCIEGQDQGYAGIHGECGCRLQ